MELPGILSVEQSPLHYCWQSLPCSLDIERVFVVLDLYIQCDETRHLEWIVVLSFSLGSWPLVV